MLSDAANNLNQLFDFLELYITHRFQVEMGNPEPIPKPVLEITGGDQYPLNNLILGYGLADEEVVMLLTALVPHMNASYFDSVLAANLPNGGEYPDFGGFKGKNHKGLLPTGETALFILAGNDREAKLTLRELFDFDKFLFRTGVLSLGTVPFGEPELSGHLIVDPEYVEYLTTGVEVKPTLSPSFPAELINTELTWEDLVLSPKTFEEVQEVQVWLTHHETLMNDWAMSDRIKPGYRVMFYGPPGTGKTMTASLLGKYTNKDVYRIDLSMVVSKYIGETEKNLGSLFNKAKNKDWILFFDEADAIFGKRTNVRDAHDKYANQEVSYLLQRIESHPGLVILASNLRDNIDDAFTRRFNTIVEFQYPTYDERLQLWQKSLPVNVVLAPEVSLESLSDKYDITGANIINAIQFACLRQLELESPDLKLEYLIKGIEREYRKEGRLI